jgi:hypothetical protein
VRSLVALAIILLFLASVPRGLAQGTPSAVIQNDSSYIDNIGDFHVVGEVLNTGDVWLDFVKVTGTFRDVNKQILDVTYTYASSNYLAPGTKGPFNVFETDSVKSSKIANYTLALDYKVANSTPGVSLAVQGAATEMDPAGDLNVVGEVKNIGLQASNSTQVVATYYDKTGKVIFVDFTYTSPEDIPPNQASSFRVIGPKNPVYLQVANFAVFAQSQQYTSVPEFNEPLLVMLTALMLIGIVTRKTQVTFKGSRL